jgi:hypothetical protein
MLSLCIAFESTQARPPKYQAKKARNLADKFVEKFREVDREVRAVSPLAVLQTSRLAAEIAEKTVPEKFTFGFWRNGGEIFYCWRLDFQPKSNESITCEVREYMLRQRAVTAVWAGEKGWIGQGGRTGFVSVWKSVTRNLDKEIPYPWGAKIRPGGVEIFRG